MPKSANKRIGECPECQAEVRLRRAPHLGQKVTCYSCGAKLEITRKDPIELDWAFDDPLEDDEELEIDFDQLDKYESYRDEADWDTRF